MNRSFGKFSHNAGVGLIEVLIALFVLVIGVLGLAGLQTKLIQSEMESQQRTYAQMLAQDMVDRISAYRNNSTALACFAGKTFGTGSSTLTCTNTAAQSDLVVWDNLLKGTSETISGTTNVGAMIGARGCIDSLGSNAYRVSVAWQGLRETAAPPTALTCGSGSYDNEKKRRVFAVVVQL